MRKGQRAMRILVNRGLISYGRTRDMIRVIDKYQQLLREAREELSTQSDLKAISQYQKRLDEN